MLDRLLSIDERPLSVARPVDARLVGVCRHFTVLLVAMLRAQGVPARARCGFGAYFNPGHFEDHWVCEYWNAMDGRWILVDAQIDDVQRAKVQPDFDLLDVPRDRFVIAGDAWARCRVGDADPSTFGIFDMRGLWFIAGNVLRESVSRDVPNQNVSVRVTLDQMGIVERTMHFNFGSWHGSTDKVGVTQPQREWDFAEGSTLSFFSEYLTLQNPNGSDVPVSIHYVTSTGATPTKRCGPQTRISNPATRN